MNYVIDATYDHAVLLKKFIQRVQFVVKEIEGPYLHHLPPGFIRNTLKETLETVQQIQKQIEERDAPCQITAP